MGDCYDIQIDPPSYVATYMLDWNWFTSPKFCISYELEISLPIVWTGFTKNCVFDLSEVKFIVRQTILSNKQAQMCSYPPKGQCEAQFFTVKHS